MRNIYFLIIIIITFIVQLNAQQWTAVTTPHPSVEQMAVADNKLFIATPLGVYYTTDGITWVHAVTGMTPVYANVYYNLTIYNFNDVLYSGAAGKLYKSVDFGANWTALTGAAPTAGTMNCTVYAKGDTIIAGWKSNDKITKSIDGGTTWTNSTLYEGVSKNIVELNGNFYVRTYLGIHKSTDVCETFTTLSGTPSNTKDGAFTVSNGVLVCGTADSSLYLSNDEGVTWTETATTQEPYCLEVVNGVLYQGTRDRKVFASSDNGTTWANLTGTGINSDGVKSFATFNGYLYASASNVLYKTVDVNSVNEEILPSEFILQQNYPNPFNPATTIQYAISSAQLVTLKVYDVLGDEIATLVN
ncbi:MAG: exo-alpha-sialidase, partial [Ignavibacteriae bacterium]|nr:exo-alpha-sialidase [Ignavibacteriota bacterium]